MSSTGESAGAAFWQEVRAHLPTGMAMSVRPLPSLPDCLIVGVVLGLDEAWQWVPANVQDDPPMAAAVAWSLVDAVTEPPTGGAAAGV